MTNSLGLGDSLESLLEVHREFQSMFVQMAAHLEQLDAQNADLQARIERLERKGGHAT